MNRDDLLPAMPDEIIVERFTGRDAHGNESYAAGTTVRANVQVTVTRGDPGASAANQPAQVSIEGTVICVPAGVTPKDRITLPFVAEKVYANNVTVHRDPLNPGQTWVEELTFVEEK